MLVGVHVCDDKKNDWPLDALDLTQSAGPNGCAVLLVTGAMNPAHRGHINMLHQARDRVEAAGIAVVGAFASPTHDGYVQNKALWKKTIGLTGEFRLAVVETMVANDPQVTASPWEVRNDAGFVDYPDVVLALSAALRENSKTSNIRCIYVCGSDLGPSAVDCARCAPCDWGGVVVVPRDTWSMDVEEDVEHRIFVAAPDDTAAFSSTDLRVAIGRGDEAAVVEAMSAAGARFLLHPTLDEFACFRGDYTKLHGVRDPALTLPPPVVPTSAHVCDDDDDDDDADGGESDCSDDFGVGDPAPAPAVAPLPPVVTEPLIYLSRAQAAVVARKFPSLAGYALPAWVPQRLVARDMRFSDAGMRRALRKTNGTPYLWATEFENVHDLWVYNEPELTIDGETYVDSETYYHAQKPGHNTCGHNTWAEWQEVRDDVMRRGIRAKFALDPSLHALLCATQGHPLLAIKPDDYWGFDARDGGQNRLAELWMELRGEVCDK